jgi:hypothetical protein
MEFAHRHLLAVAAGATAVLGLLVALGAWQAFGGSTASKPAQAVPAVHATTTSDAPMRIYIAADDAQRAKVLVEEDEAALMRYASGDTEPVAVDVIVAGPHLKEALLDIATANDIRGQQGLAPMPVVDLR